jgi:malonyl CoA-acyl carrier protein transacylase
MQNVFECAPGKVLTGLNKRIEGSLSCKALTDSNALKAAFQ